MEGYVTQYFKAVIEDKDGTFQVFRADEEKLMEFSWLRNPFVNYVAGMIEDAPKRLCFVGNRMKTVQDYQEKYDSCVRFYAPAWENDDRDIRVGSVNYRDMHERVMIDIDSRTVNIIMDRGFIIDRDRLEYIDLEAYVRMYSDGIWCVNPLAILAAAGTGENGGDYRHEDLNYGMAGIWAGDVISYSREKPGDEYADMTEVYGFRQ